MELLSELSMNSAQFRMVDFRLLFVVITGCVYGVNMGVAAAVLAGLALGFAYAADGTNWMTLFYEPMNWLPFVAYLSAGVICGYTRLKNQDRVQYARHENKLLQDKFRTLKSLYFDTQEEQKLYKRQIVSSRDSFGKIFEITKRLDVNNLAELYKRAARVLEEALDNETVAIYSVDREKGCANLEACSKKIRQEAAKQIRLADYDQALLLTRRGDVWVNNELLADYPMYLAEAKGSEDVTILIMVLRSSFEQNGIFYTNLFKIICGLIESALLRAVQYQKLSMRPLKNGEMWNHE